MKEYESTYISGNLLDSGQERNNFRVNDVLQNVSCALTFLENAKARSKEYNIRRGNVLGLVLCEITVFTSFRNDIRTKIRNRRDRVEFTNLP